MPPLSTHGLRVLRQLFASLTPELSPQLREILCLSALYMIGSYLFIWIEKTMSTTARAGQILCLAASCFDRYMCDECQGFIVGTRLHCKECEDFDLCLGCHEKGHYPAGHGPDHALETFPLVKLKLNKDSDSALQSYLHQHVWLLFASVSLSMTAIMYSDGNSRGAEVHTDYIKACTQLHNMCLEMSTNCLRKVTTTTDEQEVEESLEVLEVRQEQAFASHAQERIMGLLGAMIPPENKVAISSEVNYTFTSENFLQLLFQIASGESGHETNTQHLAMALVGQLLQRATTSCSTVDTAVALATTSPIPAESDAGAHTAEYLFSFGATCLERSGLVRWANSMASILQKMFKSASWRDVLLSHLGTSICRLKQVSIESNLSLSGPDTSADLPRYQAMFQMLDKENKGHVSKSQLRELLEPVVGTEWKSFWLISRCVRLRRAEAKVRPPQAERKLSAVEKYAESEDLKFEHFAFILTIIESQYGPIDKSVKDQKEKDKLADKESGSDKTTEQDKQIEKEKEATAAVATDKENESDSKDSTDSKTNDSKINNSKTDDSKTDDSMAIDAKSVDTKNTDTHSADVKIVDTQSTDTQRAETQCADTHRADTQSPASESTDEKITKSKDKLKADGTSVTSIKKSENGPELSSIFALYVIAGFPEVLSIGAPVRYTDYSTEYKKGVVLKHFPDKYQTLLVDRKTRRRKTKKDEYVECESHDLQVLDQQHICAFIEVIKDFTTKVKQGACVGVESVWVGSLALKALLKTLQCGLDEPVPELYTSEFVQSAIYLASQGTGFSRQWLLKDLEILSLMLYTRGQEKEDVVEISEKKKDEDKAASSCDESGQDPWQGLNETARHTFKTLHGHLDIPVSILRAVYDLHGQDANALIMAVHESASYTGVFTPDDEVKRLARKWEIKMGSANMVDKAVDTGMQLTVIRPLTDRSMEVEEADEEPSEESQKLISAVDADMSSEAIKQRKSRSTLMLKKELETQGKAGSRDFLLKINMAMAVLYARHVLMKLLADWPSSIPLNVGCRDDVQVAFILDLLNRYDTQETFQKVVKNVIACYSIDCVVPIAMAACQFLEEVNVSSVTKESEHHYKNNTLTEDKVTIPGVAFISVHFDSKCATEDGCDELVMGASSDYCQSQRVFSGQREAWVDFELPGDTVYFKFESDGSNTDWGYKFTVTGRKIGRFDTGYMILKSIFAMPKVTERLPIKDLWSSLVYVACKQTGHQRLKALHLILKILQAQFKCGGAKKLSVDLGLLKPLWTLYNKFSDYETDSSTIVPPVVRALTEVFLVAENLAMEWKVTMQYMASLMSVDEIRQTVFEGIRNVAAVSVMIGTTNKATEGFEALKSKEAKDSKTEKED